MFKNIIEDIKMSKLLYLLEIIKTKDLNDKIKAFKKLDKMKISKEMGLEILECATYDYGVDDGNGGINSSLISLCMKDYHKEYSDKIKKIFKLLNEDCQNKVVFLLSSIDNEYALDLYVDLILKYYKDSNFIPISNLYERVNSYKLLFPKLFKALKFKTLKNNILILINDYLNAGVIPDVDLKKNKKLIQDNISKIFNEALKIKFSNTSKALQNEKYLDLRFFLEIAINIEYYVSNKKTNDLINELFKRNDNQLKLFILENYIRKGKDISKINLESIAKDNASRYPLYDLLTTYEKTNLMPKKYMTGEKIALSDFFINFVLINTYKELPKNIKFVKKKVINNYLYYIFTFKYTYKNNINYDTTTNYLIETAGIDKYKDKKITSTFVGISGGFNPTKEVSLIETTNNKTLWSKLENNETIDETVDRIIPEVKIEIKKTKKSKEEKKNNKEFKKLEKAIEKKAKNSNTKLSRLIATYDWPYSSASTPKDELYWSVKIGNWVKPWNKEIKRHFTKNENLKIRGLSWAEQPQTIDEVGSIYTIHGFDLNYAGVILGPSIKFRNNRVVFDPSSSCNDKATRKRTLEDGTKKSFGKIFLRNELGLLLTRGVNGLYIYACDKELRDQLKKCI